MIPPTATRADAAVPLPAPLLEVEDLTVAFRGAPILDGVSFRLEQGQILGIVGNPAAARA